MPAGDSDESPVQNFPGGHHMPEITGDVSKHWYNTLFITDELLGS